MRVLSETALVGRGVRIGDEPERAVCKERAVCIVVAVAGRDCRLLRGVVARINSSVTTLSAALCADSGTGRCGNEGAGGLS